jgi:hypothetical protein
MGKKLTTDEFIIKSELLHNNKYDYSEVEYKNSHTKIKIICPTHGIFEQLPHNHLNGKGCIKCTNNLKLDVNIFIKRSKGIHGDKYDYSDVEYKNNKSKVKINCSMHGSFIQKAYHHMSGIGCPSCAGKIKTSENFIKKAKRVHGDKYDYSEVEYKNINCKVKIICPMHGTFEQNPHNHLSNNGCPICNESYGEKSIRLFLIKNKIKFIKNKSFEYCKNKRQLPFDYYLPDYNVCIEYDGRQHFGVVDYFGGDSAFKKRQKLDKIKDNFCKNNSILLLRIKYTNYKNIELILSRFFKLLGF